MSPSDPVSATPLSRRDFGQQTLATLLTYSLFETLLRGHALGAETPAPVAKWFQDVNSLAQDMKSQRISQVVWQKKVEELFRQIELPSLLAFLKFDDLTRNLKYVDNGARSLNFKLPEVDGLPKTLDFGRQIFAVKKGHAVVPHGHNNMATAFLILSGQFQGRHFDRLEDEPDHILIRPSIDRAFATGETSSISDYKDNIHWFTATSETAFILNIHVLDVRPGSEAPTGRVYVNPNGEKLSGGLVRAPRLGYKQAHDMFG